VEGTKRSHEDACKRGEQDYWREADQGPRGCSQVWDYEEDDEADAENRYSDSCRKKSEADGPINSIPFTSVPGPDFLCWGNLSERRAEARSDKDRNHTGGGSGQRQHAKLPM
jgi:hypothetical protein